jgi:aspartyl aminopeptidase
LTRNRVIIRHTWFDRDLGVAGKVLVHSPDGSKISTRLVNLDSPILRIPTLAIHLERGVNDNFAFNNETQLAPILALSSEKMYGFILPFQVYN